MKFSQMALADISDEYKAFTDKFKPKKTTDDCYTPENIYNEIQDYVCEKYGVDKRDIVRPFWPGGDYERFDYKDSSVVVDNPPFSIISKIVQMYLQNDIHFFLFAPTLTNFSSNNSSCAHIIANAQITYENGALVNTSFLTDLDDCIVASAPQLYARIKKTDEENRRSKKTELPKYSYPNEVLTATMVAKYSKYGVDFSVSRESTYFVRSLESQRSKGKAIFGAGFLLSEKAAAEKAAAEKAAAEKAAAEKAAAEKWELSASEIEIIKKLGKQEVGHE